MRNALVYVVIPTYNERENLSVIVREICALNISRLRILIVDDNSPDGTGTIADELALTYPVSVLHRNEKQGLGPAYVAGFARALKEQPNFIIQMDADGSHNPRDILRMLEAARNADLVVGSRYVKGGRVENWNFIRRIVSRAGSCSRFVLGIPYKDPTSGFKCYRREVLQGIDLSSVSSSGYNFQIETLYKTHLKGFRIVEIPISFSERTQGRSKFHLGIILESFFKVLLLSIRKK